MRRLIPVVLLGAAVMAAQPRSRKAHEHGHATLNIAFETTTGAPEGSIELESPAESIVGFEHAAKTAADKAAEKKALDTLRARFGEMVQLPASCKLTPQKVEVHAEGHEHTEVHAEFGVKCGGAIGGAKIQFDFAKYFPRLGEIQVQMLAGSGQTSAVIRQGRGSVSIPQ